MEANPSAGDKSEGAREVEEMVGTCKDSNMVAELVSGPPVLGNDAFPCSHDEAQGTAELNHFGDDEEKEELLVPQVLRRVETKVDTILDFLLKTCYRAQPGRSEHKSKADSDSKDLQDMRKELDVLLPMEAAETQNRSGGT